MKLTGIISTAVLALLLASCSNNSSDNSGVTLKDATIKGDETINTHWGNLEIKGTYLTKESIEKINKNLAIERAAEVYQWGLPFVNFQMWYNANREVYGANDMDFVVNNSFNERLGIVTANATTTYVIGFTNLSKSGPIVLNMPAGKIAGGILNFYEFAVQDLGLAGPDQGKGGKYLIIPPGYDESKLNTKGYFMARSETNKIFIGLRFLTTDPEETKRIQEGFTWAPYGEKMRKSKFIANTNKVFRGHPYRGLKYFETLHQYIQNEPIAPQDMIFKTYMNDLGITNGKPFNPTEEQKEILNQGAKLGELIARANQQMPRHDETYYPNRQWYRLLSNMPLSRWDDNRYYLDESNQFLYEALTITRGMKANKPGFGVSSYLVTHTDKDGNFLNGSNTYKLHLDKDIPAENFWSLVVYSEESRSFIVNENNNNDLRSCAISSRMKDLQYNDDGSIDLYIGPKAPEGKESNWIQTPEGEGWFPLFRFYGTEQPFFNKTWVIGELEKM
jgi:hypothetical protein